MSETLCFGVTVGPTPIGGSFELTSATPLGRFQRITDIRTVWPGEATHFTPWLADADNIKLLGEAIGLDLEVEAQEKSVGPFRADILCKDTVTGHYVLVENQVERTDHTHLGQLLTYAAGLDAVTIIWIARQFAEEHRSALDWLNRTTSRDINFFGLEIELWRINESPVAPKFNVVSQPNDWSRTVRQNAESPAGLSVTQQLHLDFWTQFREFMEANNSPVRVGKPSADYWKDFALGRAGFKLVAANGMRDNWSEVSLALTGPNSKGHYWALRNNDLGRIESAINGIIWRELPQNNESQLAFRIKSNPSNRQEWPTLNTWFADTLRRFDGLFRPLVARLDPSLSLGSSDGDTDNVASDI